MIPYSRQHVDADDVAAVAAVLRGDWLTQGPSVDRFEAALVEVTGAAHAVAFSSGTAALHGAAWAAGLGPGDRVATSPLSFVASANCARYVGAEVTFVDIDPTTRNLDPTRVPDSADALVAVHYAGLPVDLTALSHRPRIVIEDAAHALGASTPDGPVGNCAHSDLCCFSFHPVKTVTTGEGGAVTTNDARLAERLRRFRHHGITRPPEAPGWVYDIPEIGWNYRLTDLQAALGTSQLAKLEWMVDRRNAIADRYRAMLADLPVGLPPAAPVGWRHAYHLFAVELDRRQEVYERMRSRGIGVQVHYVPTYRFGSYGGLDESEAAVRYPATEAVYARLLSLPIFPDLTDEEQDTVVGVLAECLG
jgi:dTDP-4-amino-4,6-dideoxygalactose transaminase